MIIPSATIPSMTGTLLGDHFGQAHELRHLRPNRSCLALFALSGDEVSYQEIIERNAAAAHLEIKLMVRKANEANDRGFAFINRSIGQKRRFARQRQINGRNEK